jgi:hypothetical protein
MPLNLFHRLLFGLVVFFAMTPYLGLNAQQRDAPQIPRFIPTAGAVPDSETAVRIAEAVLIPVYGEKTVITERPFTAVLKGDTWTVQGTLPKEFANGGAALVQMSKKQGCILTILHYK